MQCEAMVRQHPCEAVAVVRWPVLRVNRWIV